MDNNPGEIKKLLEDHRDKTERFIGAVTEDFCHKMDAVLEYVKDLPLIKSRQDMLIDQVAELTEDMVVVKEIAREHSLRLRR